VGIDDEKEEERRVEGLSTVLDIFEVVKLRIQLPVL
jgi:hypothetical protein